jgi:hypothetical protein
MKYSFDLVTKPLDSLLFEKENPNCSLYIEEGKLWISGDITEEEATSMLAAHNPPAPTEPTVADKLASVGLSLEELREALGSN